MISWQIGEVKVTRVVELESVGGSRFILPDATPEAVLAYDWLRPHFVNEQGKLIMSVHALIVETPSKTIIVDTCLGNDKKRNIPAWNNLQLPFLQDLKSAGFEREQIDTVLCTHLHVDHVGWNTMLVDGEWVATFPKARYLMAESEFNYWTQEAEGEEYKTIMADSVKPVFDAGLVDLVSTSHRVCEEVFLEPTPGHTPGHVSVHIQSNGAEAVITGDSIHHPCQIAVTEWSSSADYDSEQATATRREFLEQYADTDTLIIGTHFATPTAGYVKRVGADYKLSVGSEPSAD
jgi:glyoxylase-like metal-dependent hydrolase (beta-lactamase superfamily II)